MTFAARNTAIWFCIALALICFYLSSCGWLPANAEVDPEFRIIYSGFIADAAKYGREVDYGNLVIRMGDEKEFDPNEAGNCAPGKIVSVNPRFWPALNKYGKELLIYHELGHCLLGLGDGSGALIMNSNLNETQYAFRREEYIKDLFAAKSASVSPASCEAKINTLR